MSPPMDVSLVTFPETRVAVLRHTGEGAHEHETVMKLVAWKLRLGLTDPVRYRHYGLHYVDPDQAMHHRVDFCLSIDEPVAPNDDGIAEGTIPQLRCARARDVGSREANRAARHLYEIWLPASGESAGAFPAIFHYVNTGPNVRREEAITDVYLPLGDRG